MGTTVFKKMNASPLWVNMLAMVPRHWFVYLIGLLFPAFVYINLDHGPNSDDSGNYFNFWFLGVIYMAYGVGFVVSDLINKPLLFCMPKQQLVLRKLIFALGCFVSVLFFMLAVRPENSYWAPPTMMGEWSLLLIGITLYLLVVTLALKDNRIASMVLVALALASVAVIQYYFGGSGPDIVRPPTSIFTFAALTSLLVIPWSWFSLGRRSLRRQLIGTETLSSHAGNMAMQLENSRMFQRSPRADSKDFSSTYVGSRLLTKVRRADPSSRWRLVWQQLYGVGSFQNLKLVLLTWTVAMVIAATFANNVVDAFSPVIFLYMLTVLATGQGGMIFKKSFSPFLPIGRRAYYFENFFNGLLRFVLVAGVLGTIYLAAYLITRAWPDYGISLYCLAFVELPLKGYLFCLLMAPVMLFLFHRSRSPKWLVGSLVLCWIFGAPVFEQTFTSLQTPWVVLMLIVAWVPFLTLNYLRSYKHDFV